MTPDFTDLPDVASRALGGGVVHVNDELFAAGENLVTPGPPVHDPRAFGARGKVYDGWETRRRRTPGHDLAIVRLGVRAVVHGVVVDTSYFVGNYPPRVGVAGVDLGGYPDVDELLGASWRPLVPESNVRGDSLNAFTVEGSPTCTHVMLTLHPAVAAIGWFAAGAGMGTLYPRISTLVLALSAPGEEGFNTAAKSITDAVGGSVALAFSGLLFALAPFTGPFVFTTLLGGVTVLIALRVAASR